MYFNVMLRNCFAQLDWIAVRLDDKLQQERAERQAEHQEDQRRIAELEHQLAAAQAGWMFADCMMTQYTHD